MAELLYRLGKLAAKRAWVVVVAWAVLLGLAAGSYALFAGSLTSNFDIPGTATAQVTDQLAKKLPDFSGASGSVVYHTTDNKPFTTAQQEEIQKVVAGAADLPHVATVADPFAIEEQRAAQEKAIADGMAQLDAAQQQLDAGSQQLDAAIAQAKASGTYDQAKPQFDAQVAELAKQQAALTKQRATLAAGAAQLALAKNVRTVSADGTTAVVSITFDKTVDQLPDSAKTGVKDYFESHAVDGVDVYFSSTIAQTIPEIIGVGEVVGFIIAGIVLFIMLGTFTAAGLPLLNALVGVGVGVLFCLSLSGVINEASVTPVLGVMLGLAVGIDYSLFIINRHRKQLMQGVELHESIGLANGTAGNAVVFAGSTVVVALLALNVTGIPFIGTMGTVGAICVAIAVVVAVTLTPAMLRFVGPRVLTRKARATMGHEQHTVMTVKPMSTVRAVLTTIVAVVVLLVIALPVLSLRLGLPDASSDPTNSTTYKAYTLMHDKFGAGSNGALVVAAPVAPGLTDQQIAAQQLVISKKINSLDNVEAVVPIGVSKDKTLMAFEVLPTGGPNDESTAQLVRDIRALESPGTSEQPGCRRRRERQHRRLGQDRGSTPDLPRGRHRPVPDHPDRRLPFTAGSCGRDRRFRPVAAGDLRPAGRRVPVGLVRVAVRHPQHRAGAELPADHPGRHPVRARDGLPAVPGVGNARSLCARRARTRGCDARIQGRPNGRHRGRDHHDRHLQRLHLLGLGVHRRARPGAGLRHPR